VLDVDTDLGQRPLSGSRQQEAAVTEPKRLSRNQAFGERNAESAGEVVVAGAAGAERVPSIAAAQRGDLHGTSQSGQHLERIGDGFRRESVPRLAAALLAGDEAARDKARQVLARRARCHACPPGELARGKRLAAEQGVEHRGTGRVADQRRYRGGVDVGV
jgi:hypothetical protein